jgi:acetyltransferase-like isoleucine patch superfamily enzyme
MDWNQPVRTKLGGVTPFARLSAMFGHYDFRVLVDGAFIDVGAGSLSVIERIQFRGSGRLGRIGRFCEVNASAKILSGAEHEHDVPVNVSFIGLPVFETAFPRPAMKPFNQVNIGNGVLISTNAVVLDGVSIGDGAVIGAGAIVTRDVEAFGVYAGVPARKLRDRAPFAPWWDFDAAYMLENHGQLNQLALDPDAKHRYRKPRPPFVLDLRNGAFDLKGFMKGESIAPFNEAPAKVREYVTQAAQSEHPYWLADCWA